MPTTRPELHHKIIELIEKKGRRATVGVCSLSDVVDLGSVLVQAHMGGTDRVAAAILLEATAKRFSTEGAEAPVHTYLLNLAKEMEILSKRPQG